MFNACHCRVDKVQYNSLISSRDMLNPLTIFEKNLANKHFLNPLKNNFLEGNHTSLFYHNILAL